MSFSEHLQVSSELLEWINRRDLSLVFALQHDNTLVFLSPNDEGRIQGVARQIQHPRSLHVDRNRLVVATHYQIHELVNVLPESATYDGYDHIYVLRRTHTTGAIDLQSLSGGVDEPPRFVSRRYNAVGTLSERYSFDMLWRASSSNQLSSEEAFQVTGVVKNAQQDACYVTGIYEDGQEATGAVVQIGSETLVAKGAFAPVKPQVHEGQLFLVDARNGSLLRVRECGETETMVHLPKIPSTLSLYDGFALVTIPSSSFEEEDRESLSSEQNHRTSGAELLLIELTTEKIIGKAQWPDGVGPPSDLQVLPNAQRPTALGPAAAELPRTVVFEVEGGLVYHQVSPEQGTPDSFGRPAPAEVASSPTIPKELTVPDAAEQAARVGESQSYSFYPGREAAQSFFERFQPLFPERFRRRIQTGAIDPTAPLIGVAVAIDDRPVGIAAASMPNNSGVADAHALKVLPPHRGRGVGTALLERLEDLVRETGARVLQGSFRASISSLPALERVLEKLNWEPPKVKRYLYKGERSLVPESFIQRLSKEPAEGRLFEWGDLTAEERSDIEDRLNSTGELAIPESLSPFQLGTSVDLDCSVGLRHDGRVAGWMITHRLTEDILQYTTLYVEPRLRGPGVGTTLLAEAIRRQAKRTNIPKFIWMVDADKSRMRRFIDIRLSEVVDERDKLLLAATRLRSDPSGTEASE